jgi:DNA-binding NtrC family response regulator
VPALARFFLHRYSEENRRDAPPLPGEVVEVLQRHDWPGNVRELENYVERAVVLSNGGPITAELVRPVSRGELGQVGKRRGKGGNMPSLIQQLVQTAIQTVPEEGNLYHRVIEGVERELIEQVLLLCGGVHVNAAKRLGINRNTLHNKVSTYEKNAD